MASRKVKTGKRTQRLLKELGNWCAKARGLQYHVSKELGLDRQVVNHWLAGRQAPTAEQILMLQEILAPDKADIRQQWVDALRPQPRPKTRGRGDA